MRLTKKCNRICIDWFWLPQIWCAWIRSRRGSKLVERTSQLRSTDLCDSTALNPPCKGLSRGRSIPWHEFHRRWIWRACSCHRSTILKLSSLAPRTNYLCRSTRLRCCTSLSNRSNIRSPVISTDRYIFDQFFGQQWYILFKKKRRKANIPLHSPRYNLDSKWSSIVRKRSLEFLISAFAPLPGWCIPRSPFPPHPRSSRCNPYFPRWGVVWTFPPCHLSPERQRSRWWFSRSRIQACPWNFSGRKIVRVSDTKWRDSAFCKFSILINNDISSN